MDVTALSVNKEEAAHLYQEYLKHRHYETPIDAEIKRTYKALAKGTTVIKALESIVAAGVDEHGLPKLSIVRADFPSCVCRREANGAFTLTGSTGNRRERESRAADVRYAFPAGSLPEGPNPRDRNGYWKWDGYRAVVPIIPIQHRPRRSLPSYHVLWEVEEWRENHVPRDPYLLRRLGKGDLWMVVAAWDLTEVERAALQSRVSVN